MTALIKRGFDTDRINNPEYLAARMSMLNMEDFRTGTEVHDLLVMIRTDVNRTVEKIADDWNMSPQLVSYWKMRMRKERVIDIEKFAVESEYTRATKHCHYRKGCHVIWNKIKKERVWFLCDQITIILRANPEELQKFLEAA